MAQNLVQTIITDEQIAEAKAALDVLERIFPDFIVLDVADRRSIRRMGTKFEHSAARPSWWGRKIPS